MTPNIVIINEDPFHPKYINIVELASYLCPTDSVQRFVFNNRQNVNSLSSLDLEHNEITIFSNTILSKAFELVKRLNNPVSFRAYLWLEFMGETLKRYIQACEFDGNNILADLERVNSITNSNPTVGKLMAYVGENFDVEPPNLSEDAVFGPLINQLIDEGLQKGELWAKRQKKWINYICVLPMDTGLAPFFIRDYFKWATGNLNNKNWPAYVPSFGADGNEIEKVNQNNQHFQEFQNKMKIEDQKFQREMELFSKFDREIEEMLDDMKEVSYKQFLCLANSRKLSGHCVAGKELINNKIGEWVRPISAKKTGELSTHEIILDDGKLPKPLDVLTVSLKGRRAHTYQIENYLICGGQRWIKKRMLKPSALHKFCDGVNSLWLNGYHSYNGFNDRIPQDIAETKISSSLLFVKPDELSIIVNDELDKIKVRAEISFNNENYRLMVTDPDVEETYMKKNYGTYPIHKNNIFICVSIGEPFQKYCYKLVASILIFE